MHTYRRYFLLIVLFVIFITLCGVLLLILHPARHVFYTSNGYFPNELFIQPNTTVYFHNISRSSFWPASNLHPEHTQYASFDPQTALSPMTTWSFTFVEPKRYGFHDHLAPQHTGAITVRNEDGTLPVLDCENVESSECWEQRILSALENNGVTAAFDELMYLVATYPNFTDDCHGYAHLIGEHAFELYKNNMEVLVTPAANTCGFGFYHGFMGTLLLTTGDIAMARAFCEYIDAQDSLGTSATVSACYHGSGHGAVDGGDPRAWGDPRAIMEPGFALCAALAATDFQEYLCHTGVYNAIEILSQDPTYKIGYLREDPFMLCVDEPIERQEACYTNWMPALVEKTGGDFDVALRYIDERIENGEVPTIEGYTTKEMVVLSTTHEFIRLYQDEPDYAERGIALCQGQTPESDRLACFEGLSGGHIKYGHRDTAHKKNLTFCAYPALAEDEKDVCYRHLLTRLANQYTTEQSQAICAEVPTRFRERYCD